MAYSKAMGDVTSDDPEMRPHPECQCSNAAAAVFCNTGHLLECHYPLTCEQVRCSHWQRQQEMEAMSSPATPS